MTLPHWATQDVLATLKRVASFEVTYSIVSHKRKEKARLSGGENNKRGDSFKIVWGEKCSIKAFKVFPVGLRVKAIFLSVNMLSWVSQKHIGTYELMGQR